MASLNIKSIPPLLPLSLSRSLPAWLPLGLLSVSRITSKKPHIHSPLLTCMYIHAALHLAGWLSCLGPPSAQLKSASAVAGSIPPHEEVSTTQRGSAFELFYSFESASMCVVLWTHVNGNLLEFSEVRGRPSARPTLLSPIPHCLFVWGISLDSIPVPRSSCLVFPAPPALSCPDEDGGG